MDHHHILNFNSGTGDKIVKVRMFDRKKSKVGLAPGTLVHVGEKKPRGSWSESGLTIRVS